MTPDYTHIDMSKLERMTDKIQLAVFLDLFPDECGDVKNLLRALVYNGCPFSAIIKTFKQLCEQHMENQEE